MENASKALIIAGAILLAILLISLGLIVFRNASGTINNANLNKEEIQAFNYQFEAYIGSNKSAAEIRSMFQTVIASNGANADSKVAVEAAKDVITDKKIEGNPTTIPTITAANKYTVTPSYAASGLINKLTITK